MGLSFIFFFYFYLLDICDGRRLEIGIVQHLTVFNADSRHCPNSAVADEEGVVMAYCKAPEVKQWKRHTNVSCIYTRVDSKV